MTRRRLAAATRIVDVVMVIPVRPETEKAQVEGHWGARTTRVRGRQKGKRMDESTHTASQSEDALDWAMSAILAMALRVADQGDTTTSRETVAEADE